MSKRECGSCTLCCTVLGLPELNKRAGTRCIYAKDDLGCRIHDNKPAPCAQFQCAWLQGAGSETMKPSLSHVVLTVTNDNKGIVAHCDPKDPQAWRRGEMGDFVMEMQTKGLMVVTTVGEKRTQLPAVVLAP